MLEGLEVALEGKDIRSVLWVLNQLHASQGSIASLMDKCFQVGDMTFCWHISLINCFAGLFGSCLFVQPVLLLCTAHQLAVDLSHNDPEEGLALRLEWLKEIVMWLINFVQDLRDSIVPQSGKSLDSVIKSILVAMKQAETRHSATLAGSSARRTDLKMLCSILTTSFK